MTRCLYHASIHEFLQLSPEALLGTFVDNYHGVAMTTTNEAWADEIRIMQEVLLPWKDEDGQVIFEYDIPRLGKRIDVVLLLRGLIFCLEFKTRQEAKKENMQSYIEQVLDYALDLKNFHLLSQNRIIVPILIHPWISKSSSVFQASVYDDSIYNGSRALPLASKVQNLLIADFLNYLALRHNVYLSTMDEELKKNFNPRP